VKEACFGKQKGEFWKKREHHFEGNKQMNRLETDNN
jgi:hypothetical protein